MDPFITGDVARKAWPAREAITVLSEVFNVHFMVFIDPRIEPGMPNGWLDGCSTSKIDANKAYNQKCRRVSAHHRTQKIKSASIFDTEKWREIFL